MKVKKLLIAALCLIVTVLYGVRVYSVNHSPMLEYMPNKIVNKAGTRVEMAKGYYHIGYADLTGYYLQVESTRLVTTESLLAKYGMTMNDLERLNISPDCQYVYIVTATFDYEGEGDPTKKVVDLSSFKLVGPDYYFDFSTELNLLKGLNPKLDGNYMFAIGSGKPIEVELPFLIKTQSECAVSPEYLAKTKPKLLISTYPDEIYLELELIADKIKQT